MNPARSLYLMCLFPPNKWSLAIRAFAYNDIAVAKISPTTPPAQPRGTITAAEYPSTYALLIPVVRTNPTCNHESTQFQQDKKNSITKAYIHHFIEYNMILTNLPLNISRF